MLTLHEDTINMEFPQFRMLKNGKSYYCIYSENSFSELQQVGSKWFKYEFVVTQFPDKLRLQELLQQQDPYIEISASDYQRIHEQI